ncbi:MULTISPECIES: C1 family peptidase [unclassified Mesorhizobium]|uniref:C1 family peptidase n=1 Tax=unclassified Mesorhizobium TaxID=325217 RepID=UPI0015E3F87A|nr:MULTISPECIES: C1 family peptidase [unclassified Mesorhizobium]
MIATKVDFRSDLPPAERQGRRTCCLAFATSSAHEHSRGDGRSLSIEYLYFQSVGRSPGANPDMGVAMGAVASAIQDDGQPLEAIWPYQQVQLYAPDWMPPDNLGQLFHADADVGKLEAKKICEHLDQERVVVLGLVITEGFRTPDQSGRINVSATDPERGGHAVLAVGYGYDQNGDLYVLIRNSWGTAWGLKGHAWVSKAYLDAQLYETAVIFKREQ